MSATSTKPRALSPEEKRRLSHYQKVIGRAAPRKPRFKNRVRSSYDECCPVCGDKNVIYDERALKIEFFVKKMVPSEDGDPKEITDGVTAYSGHSICDKCKLLLKPADFDPMLEDIRETIRSANWEIDTEKQTIQHRAGYSLQS